MDSKQVMTLACLTVLGWIVLTCSSAPAKPPRCLHTGSSRRVCRCWLRSQSNRTRTRCSWSWSRGRCKSCTSAPGPRRYHERTAACTGCSGRSAQTCIRLGYLGCSECSKPPPHRALAGNTASPRVRLDVDWSPRSDRCAASKWAPVAGKLAWPRCDWDRADSRKASTVRREKIHSSWGLAQAFSRRRPIINRQWRKHCLLSWGAIYFSWTDIQAASGDRWLGSSTLQLTR